MLHQKQENNDCQKGKIRPLSSQEVDSRDKSEIENLHKAGPIAIADFTINNEGNLNDLKNTIDKIWKDILEG